MTLGIAAWTAMPSPAANINWAQTAGGSQDFNTGSNWTGGIVPGANVDDVANMQNANIIAAQMTNVSATRTISGMTIGDNSTGATNVFKMTVTSSPGQKLIFDNPSGSATLSKPNRTNAVADEISAAMEIADGETLAVTISTNTLLLSGALTGSDSAVLSFANAGGTSRLTGDLSGFSGTIRTVTGNATVGGANLAFDFHETDLSANMVEVNSLGPGGGTNLAQAASRYFRFGRGDNIGGTSLIKIGSLSGNGWINPQTGGSSDPYTEVNYEVGYLDDANTEFGGTIIRRATSTFTKVGAGSLTLSGPNYYEGTTVVSNGTLIAGADVSSSTLAQTAVSMPVGSTITLAGHNLSAGDRVTFSGTAGTGMTTTTNYVVFDTPSINTFRVALATAPAAVISVTTAWADMEVTQQSPFGAGNVPVQLGTGGASTNSVSLLAGTLANPSVTIERDVTVGDNAAGTSTLGSTVNGNSVFSGDIALGKSVQLVSASVGPNTVTFSGELSGATAGVTKVGLGSVTLTAFNTYNGNTSVEAGNLILAEAYLEDTADVLLSGGSLLTLEFNETDLVNALWFDGLPQRAGTHGAIGSGADWESVLFSGPGLLLVVPEPSTIVLALLAGVMGIGYVRRTRFAGGKC